MNGMSSATIKPFATNRNRIMAQKLPHRMWNHQPHNVCRRSCKQNAFNSTWHNLCARRHSPTAVHAAQLLRYLIIAGLAILLLAYLVIKIVKQGFKMTLWLECLRAGTALTNLRVLTSLAFLGWPVDVCCNKWTVWHRREAAASTKALSPS